MLYRAGSANKTSGENVFPCNSIGFKHSPPTQRKHPYALPFLISNAFPRQRNLVARFKLVSGVACIATLGVLGPLSPLQCNTGSGSLEGKRICLASLINICRRLSMSIFCSREAAESGFSGSHDAFQITRTVTAHGRKRLLVSSLCIPQNRKGFCSLQYPAALRLLQDLGIDVHESPSKTSKGRRGRTLGHRATMIFEPETSRTARQIKDALQQALWELKSKIKEATKTSDGSSFLSPQELDTLVLCCHVRCLVPELLCKARAAAGSIPANHIQRVMNTTQSALEQYAASEFFQDWKSLVSLDKQKLKNQIPIPFAGVTLERVKKCLVLATHYAIESTSSLGNLFRLLRSRSNRLKTSDADGSTNNPLMVVQDILKSALPAHREAITFISRKANPFRLSTLFPLSIPEEPPSPSCVEPSTDVSDSVSNNSYTFEGSHTIYDLVDTLAAVSRGLVIFKRLQRLKDFKHAFGFWEKHFNNTSKKLNEVDPPLAAMQQNQDYKTMQERFYTAVLTSTYARQHLRGKASTPSFIATPLNLNNMLETHLRIVTKTIHLRVSKLVDDALLCRQLQRQFAESQDQTAKEATERLKRYGNELTLACECIKEKLADFNTRISEPLRSPSASPELFTSNIRELVTLPSTSSEHFTSEVTKPLGPSPTPPDNSALKVSAPVKSPSSSLDINALTERPQQTHNERSNPVLYTSDNSSYFSKPDILPQTSGSTAASLPLLTDATNSTTRGDKLYQGSNASNTGVPCKVAVRPSVICFAPASRKPPAVDLSPPNAEKAPQVNFVRVSEQNAKHPGRLDNTAGEQKNQTNTLHRTTLPLKRRLDDHSDSILDANKFNLADKHNKQCNFQPRSPFLLKELLTPTSVTKDNFLQPHRPAGSNSYDQHEQPACRAHNAFPHSASQVPGSARKRLLSLSNIAVLKRLVHNKVTRNRERRRQNAVSNIWRPF